MGSFYILFIHRLPPIGQNIKCMDFFKDNNLNDVIFIIEHVSMS